MSETRGRKLGYKHSQETKDKIGKSAMEAPRPPHPQETKDKIRKALTGTPHPEKRKESIAKGKALYELDEKCITRFEELKSGYPEQEDFFLDHQDELLFAMRDVRTEKELRDIRRYVETLTLRPDEPYQYSSSSCYAAEDVMIALIDFKRSIIQKYH